MSLTQSDVSRGGPQLAVITELLVQCLADPGCHGSDQVLAEILHRRQQATGDPALPGGCLVPPCHPGADLCATAAGENRLVLYCAVCQVPLLIVATWRPPDVDVQPALAAGAEGAW